MLGAGAAAVASGYQASIARDQEHRTLRAYVVVRATLKDGFSSSGGPVADLAIENMGQTPVYDAKSFVTTEALLIGGAGMPTRLSEVTVDCAQKLSQEQVHGTTFAKNHLEETGISKAKLPADDQFLFYVYGTVCYRDIFQAIHHTRLCFVWHSDQNGPDVCVYEDVAWD